MKTRRGFVSNSSTTSFCIYGARTEVDDENWKGKDPLYKILDKLDINIQYSEYDGHYLGACWSGIREEETRKEFCERITAEVLQIDPKATEFGTYKEAYRDG